MPSYYFFYHLTCRVWLISLGGLPFPEGKGEGMDLGERKCMEEGLGGDEAGNQKWLEYMREE